MTVTKSVIKLDPGQATIFVSLANKCDFDVDISYGHVTLDAKSILGVMSIDFRHYLTVTFCGENDIFQNFLKEHAA